MPILTQCPSCERQLRVPDNLLGKKVKCPTCGSTFTATAEDEDEPAAAPPREEEEAPRPSRRPAPAEDEDEDEQEEPRPRRRPAARVDDEDEDEEEDDVPRPRRRRRLRRDAVSHRGGMILTLGILSLVVSAVGFCVCGIVLCPVGLGMGLPAWIMGQADRGKMRAGVMDPSGMGATTGGWICGIIGTIIGGLGLLCAIAGFVMMGMGGFQGFPGKKF